MSECYADVLRAKDEKVKNRVELFKKAGTSEKTIMQETLEAACNLSNKELNDVITKMIDIVLNEKDEIQKEILSYKAKCFAEISLRRNDHTRNEDKFTA